MRIMRPQWRGICLDGKDWGLSLPAMQSLRSLQIETATEDREAKAQEKASKLQKAAEDKGDLADTTATRDADQTYLDDLVAECTQKS